MKKFIKYINKDLIRNINKKSINWIIKISPYELWKRLKIA